ncbi:MAG TPA: type II secretion system F family protein [Armatimonadota bacterium]|nr:type II secretion system F family protein [Armatimonadota bacterium]
MPLFRYEIVDKSGRTLIGVTDAASESDVRERLISKGCTVKVVMPAAPSQSPPRLQAVRARAMRTLRTSAPPNELMVFFRSLQSCLQAGMSTFEALTQIGRQTPNRGMRIILERMASRVQAGGKLSDAMAEFPRAFPAHAVGVVAAGEIGGFLPAMVGDIALDYELARRASNRLLRILCIVGWINAIGTFLIAPFLPIFLPTVFKEGQGSIGAAIAAYTKWTALHVALPSLILIGGYFLIAAVFRQPSMRPLAHRLVLRVPGYAQASRMRSLASFTRILWRLQNAGILPAQAWDAASRASENSVVGVRLWEQAPALQSGRKFGEAVAATGLFTSEDSRMLAAAEMGGQIVDGFQRMAAHYEDTALWAVGRTKWFGLHVVILVNIIAIGVAVIWGVAVPYRNLFTMFGI